MEAMASFPRNIHINTTLHADCIMDFIEWDLFDVYIYMVQTILSNFKVNTPFKELMKIKKKNRFYAERC